MDVRQYSKNGEQISIVLRSGYIVMIDAGFYYPFKNNSILTPKENIIEHIKTNFEYAELDLIGIIQLDNFKAGRYSMDITSIKSVYRDKDEIQKFDGDKGYFGIDTATLLIIDYEDFELFTKIAHEGVFDFSYDYQKPIEKLNTIIGHQSFAIIESPRIGMGYDFEGDGSYFIDKSSFKLVEVYDEHSDKFNKFSGDI